jgi:PAS domain S-box-containing protein
VVHAFPLAARRPLAAALTSALEGTERTVLLPDAEGEERLEATCRPAGAGLPGGVCVVRDLELLGGGTLLVEAQRAFEITFRHSPIGQGLLSRTGRWLRVNGALAELLGRPEEELVGAEAVDAMHPEDRADERERLIGLVDGAEDHYVVGTRFLHVDGHVVRTHTRMTRITDEDGLARGFVAQVVDAAAWRRFRAG